MACQLLVRYLKNYFFFSSEYFFPVTLFVMCLWTWWFRLILGGSDSKASACKVGDPGSSPGEGNGKPLQYSSVQFSSVAQSCPTLCDPMNCSMPGLPVHHQLPKFTQTHVHQVGDAIQPSHPLSSPSPPAPSPSQHQSLFQMSQLFS